MESRIVASAAAAALLLALGSLTACEDPTAGSGEQLRASRSQQREARSPRVDQAADRDRPSAPRRTPERREAPRPPGVDRSRTFVVTRVVDGDTLEVGPGIDVRLVGIDTPEIGECGYEKAASALEQLVLHRQVVLTRPREDRDRYGRLLRYVDVGGVDAGLRLIGAGLAVARYDSRDGYGFHPREPRYVAADRGAPALRCAQPRGFAAPAAGSACAPGYTPCVPVFPPDVDCADVDGPVTVTGSDPHGLDGDGDGTACE